MPKKHGSEVDPKVKPRKDMRPPQRQSTLTEDQVADLTEAFSLLDMEGKGTIPTDKLSSLLRSLGRNPTQEEVDHMIKMMDVRQKGTLTLEQFLQIMSRRMTEDNFEEVLREAFNFFDVDRDGVIGASELRCVMESLGMYIADTEVKDMLNEGDVDGDGLFTYDDFMSFATDVLIKHDKVPCPL